MLKALRQSLALIGIILCFGTIASGEGSTVTDDKYNSDVSSLPFPDLEPKLTTYAAEIVKVAKHPCDPPVFDYPRWEGFPVTRCKYHGAGATVFSFFLNADRDKLSRWIVTACLDANRINQTKNTVGCIDKLVSKMNAASTGNVFPISGFVPEGFSGKKCYVFRDGLTIGTPSLPLDQKGKPVWPRPNFKTCGLPAPNERVDVHVEPATWIGKYARLARTTRSQYRDNGGQFDVGTYGPNGAGWIEVTRELYQKAWKSDRYELLSITAISENLGK